MDGQESGRRLAGRVVAELQGAGGVVVDALGCEADVRCGVGEEACGDLIGGSDPLEFAVGDEPFNFGASAFPAHGVGPR
jgi:hypothetical protein